VLHVVRRRNPSLGIVLAPCRVQGEGAAREIAEAIRILNQWNAAAEGEGVPIDLILVTRGGGSLEDLWAFNEEIVARAVFESQVPVVSAVGHEIDFTISDFVADVRAATPSAAAEIITEGVFSSCQFVAKSNLRMRQLCLQQFANKRDWLDDTRQRLARGHPRRRMQDWMQQLDDLQGSMARCGRQATRQLRSSWQQWTARLGRVRPALLIRQRSELLQSELRRLREQAGHRLREHRTALAILESRLRLLGPEQVLARGYSITADATTGKVLRSPDQVKTGQRLKTRLKAGQLFSRAE
jgi:exodeoxyribonuclease VII large subunit